MRPIRVAVMLSEMQLPTWTLNILEWINNDSRFEFVLIIRHPEAQKRRSLSDASQNSFTRILMDGIRRIEWKLLQKRELELFQVRDVQAQLFETPKLEVWPETSKDGLSYRLKEEDCQAIEFFRPDVILQFGLDGITGRVVDVATHGIWCLNHGDSYGNRGGPVGFWEVYFREDASSVTLQRLNEDRDGGTILKRALYPTQRFWLKNLAFLYCRGNLLVFDALTELAETGCVKPVHVDVDLYSHRIVGRPRAAEAINYILKQSLLVFTIASRKVCNRSSIWKIGYFKNCKDKVVLCRATLFEPPKGRFFADPFIVRHEDTDFVFFEDFYFSDNRGRISVAKEENGALHFVGEVLNMPYHLSFPFTFWFGGKLYMVPESAKNQSIQLWECVDFPLKWQKVHDIYNGVSAADTMIIEHNEHWWMFTNIDRAGDKNFCSELSIFYSKCPLSRDWTAHPRNPVIMDSRRARNAGLIRSNGDIFRISQRQAYNVYGKALNINKINTLTTSEYDEQVLQTHYPLFDRKARQMHHFDRKDESVVFDFTTLGTTRPLISMVPISLPAGIRRFISPLRRSSGLVPWIVGRWSLGKLMKVRTSVSAWSISAASLASQVVAPL